MKYRNPIIPGFYPDPSICRVGDEFYLVNSTFEYFPGVPVFRSRDLVHWEQIGHCLTRTSQLKLDKEYSSGGIFAPTIRWHNGRFYMVTTHVTAWRNFYVWTDDPAGEWSDPVWLDQVGIDPSLLFDRDGTVYFVSNGGLRDSTYRPGIYLSTIDIETGRLLRKPRLIWRGAGWDYVEGPHLYHIGRWYYLMAAEGGTEYGHMVTIARSRSPFGPFVSCPANPILSHRSTEGPIQGTGHADIVSDCRERWWLVCLAFRPTVYPPRHHLGRETFLSPLTWGRDGWPVIGKAGRIALEMNGPLPRQQSVPAAPARDDFDSARLALCWNFLRNPYDRDWSLTARPGFLRLQGSAVTMNDRDSPAWVGRRQCHFDCRIRALLHFEPCEDNQEAGLSIRQNEQFHYELVVTRRRGKRCVLVRRTLGSLSKEESWTEAPDGPIELAVRADKRLYHLSFASTGSDQHDIFTAECAMLAKEVAGGFTGVYLGMYATGNGTPSSAPADFDWFEYEPLTEASTR